MLPWIFLPKVELQMEHNYWNSEEEHSLERRDWDLFTWNIIITTIVHLLRLWNFCQLAYSNFAPVEWNAQSILCLILNQMNICLKLIKTKEKKDGKFMPGPSEMRWGRKENLDFQSSLWRKKFHTRTTWWAALKKTPQSLILRLNPY